MTGKEALEYLKSLSEEELENIIHVGWWELSDVETKRNNMLDNDEYNKEQKQRLRELNREHMMNILESCVYDNTKYSDSTTEAINDDIDDVLEDVANGEYFEDEED